MVCKVFGAGERCGRQRILPVTDADMVIAADGGLAWLSELEMEPDFVLGDFDSLEGEPPEGAVIHPTRKNDTDMGLAVQEGIRRGFACFELYGGTGGREDHTMANYQLLKKIALLGGRGYLIGPCMTATVILDSEIGFRRKSTGTISVFSMDETAEGVNLKGLAYELNDVELSNSFALGVSNEFVGTEARIAVKRGALLIIGEYLPDDVIEKQLDRRKT